MAGWPGTRLAPNLPGGPRAALVIATTSYQDPELRQLRAPAHDAEDLAEVLGDPGIGAFAVTRVSDAEERQARRVIDVFLSSRGVGDLVVVYLSCHGVLDRRNRLYFAAADTLKAHLGSTGIPSAWVQEQLEECRARSKVLILDCCFSGAFAHGSKGDADLDLERRLTGHGRGQAVLTASRAGEYSFEGQALPGVTVAGSVFTAGLVEGLRTGAADVGGDGYVSVDEAYDYAYDYVVQSGASQTPQRWLFGGEGAIVLARSPAGVAVTPASPLGALAFSLDSPFPAVRIGAVNTLGEWLAGGDPARALTAEQQLRRIADTDLPAVSAAARAYLPGPQPADTTRHPNKEFPGRHRRPDQRPARDGQQALPPSRPAAAPSGPQTHGEKPAGQATAPPDGDILGEAAKEGPASVRGDPGRAVRLLADAEHTAQSIPDESAKALALVRVAEALAATDPGRAARLIADAERTAQSITSESSKAWALASVVKRLDATDPDRAARLLAGFERTVQSVTDETGRVWALSDVAKALAATDPGRAARLIADAERTAQSITDEYWKVLALIRVAKALAATDPGRAAQLIAAAERTAPWIPDETERGWALSDVAKALGATHPVRAARLIAAAERAAPWIPDETKRASALVSVTGALAATDPGPAEQLARSITDESLKAWALASVAEALAATDPGRAEHLARSITDKYSKASALASVAEALAATDPGRAEHLARSITDETKRASALASVAEALAATDPGRAEHLAQSITDETKRASALASVAEALAATDPGRAEHLAQSITEKYQKALALASVAEALAVTSP
jgi:Caspase domain